MRILAVNTGSSSVRLATFTGATLALEAQRRYELPVDDPTEQIRDIVDQAPEPLTAVGHRIVHGGEHLRATTELTAATEALIEAASAYAPLHNPRALTWIRACRDALGDETPQYAAFDTAFFAHLPEAAATYGLPRALARSHGVRRYGFHGLAHKSMWERWRELSGGRTSGRLITLQLGAGASASAIRDGRPLDTSMGFSPLEGLLMATRCGDIDAGALLHLQKAERIAPEAMEDVLNRESGLLGVSGTSAEIRELAASSSPDARLALDVYVHHARKYVGAYLMTLGGCDGIVFGGGVGENQPDIRARILQDAKWAGIRLDPERNQRIRGEGRISATDSLTSVWVIPPDEQHLIASEVATAHRGNTTTRAPTTR